MRVLLRDMFQGQQLIRAVAVPGAWKRNPLF